MVNVNEVFITKEVAEKLNLTTSYLIRLAKKLKNDGILSDNDVRLAGKSNYIFNRTAIEVIEKTLKK